MAIKIRGMGVSTCTRRVLMTLEEKGIPYELIPTDIMKGESKTPEFLAKQPFGKIPVLEDGDVELFESRAMARYVAEKKGGTDLLGSSDKQKALTDVWLEVEAQNFNPPASELVYEKMFKAWFGQTTDEAAVAKHLEALNKVLDVYEGILKTRPYLAGQEFSLADLSHLPYGDYLHKSGITEPFDSRPAVKDWWARITARPAWQKVSALQ